MKFKFAHIDESYRIRTFLSFEAVHFYTQAQNEYPTNDIVDACKRENEQQILDTIYGDLWYALNKEVNEIGRKMKNGRSWSHVDILCAIEDMQAKLLAIMREKGHEETDESIL